MAERERVTKEPWLAVALSWLLPGLGQFYAGSWVAGALFLLAGLLLPGLALVMLLGASGGLLVGAGLLAGRLVVWLMGLFHAHACARRRNASEAEQARKAAKDPYLGVVLTQLLPGIGHLYLRKWVWGVGLLLVTLATWVIVAVSFVAGLFVLPLYGAGACLLAYVAAPRERRRGKAGIAAVCALTAGLGWLQPSVALLARAYVVEAFHVTAGSMVPTIQAGDRILVWKPLFTPQRGDLVALRVPGKRDTVFVKRVAAIGGEAIEFRENGIYVGGSRLSEGAFGRLAYVPMGPFPPGVKQFGLWGEPFRIPAGHVFVVGDNIGRSYDSRMFGPVPVADVIGRAYKRYWPLNRAGPIG